MPTRSHTATVVVGGRGFLGSALTRRLQEDGHVVTVHGREHPLTGPDGLAAPLREAARVVWAASRINPVIAAGRPDVADADVATFTEFLHALARDGRPDVRVALLSSGGTVYGAGTPPFHEDSPAVPVNRYGCTKLALERLLHDAPVDGVVVRVANAYGPGQPVAPGQGVVSHWLEAAAEGRDLVVFGDLEVVRDFVYVDDVAEAVAALLTAPSLRHDTYNVGSSRGTTLDELRGHVEAAVGHPLRVRLEPARAVDVRESWLDTTRISEVIGWHPRTVLREGVARQWQAMSRARHDRTAAAR
ncbi:NAD-dependent epimerase/dehydratase family protein [Cellulomonas sp.]|uniref:NAD-dependent epimerase/dehydratase family protein n=1 Tax=Cellulomonas sp. TaxID=40001 RepID=UPI0028120C50|nr:NAD-dependent epimerase/dehydratase family protein [Cellulomonas sp.]